MYLYMHICKCKHVYAYSHNLQGGRQVLPIQDWCTDA